MSDQNDSAILVASGGGRGKPTSATLPKINSCGDIGLKIGRDGTWYYEGSPIGRKPLVKLFASVLRREADGYYLVTPVEKVPIEVEDAPFLAVAMEVTGEGEAQTLRFRTNLDETVDAGPECGLSFREEADGSFTPHVELRGGLPARLTRPVYYELVALSVQGPAGQGQGVWSGGSFFAFPATARA
ncbi:MAG TPA: DUF1285 domain-containing protein [Methyloceanibacter sp.]|nr:DUF1285 domain-containing protein [Methyloceanibacter sp.]